MSPGARSAIERFARSPGWQLVMGAAVLAVAFPSRLPGSLGLLALAGAAGIGVAWLWPRLPISVRDPSPGIATALACFVVVVVGLSTFWDALVTSPDWQIGDWGPQHAVLRHGMSALPGWHLPVWNHLISTGDAPFELYPKLAYLVTGNLALALGLDGDLPHAYMVVAVITHVGLAVGTTALAARVAPRPIACVIGIAALLESGTVSQGGTVDLFRWALLHSIFALALFTIAANGIAAMLARPRMRATLAIWIGTALAAIAHPVGLLLAVACGVALLAVALLAHDTPPRRPLAAAMHIGIGIALAATWWMPLAARILAYGQHFPNTAMGAADLVTKLLAVAWPTSAFGAVIFAGLGGVVAGLWSRRAVPVFVAATTLVLYLGLCDAGYLALDLAPGMAVARLGTERLTSMVRPFLGACAAYLLGILFHQVRRGWAAASPRRRQIAAAIAGMLAFSLLRELPAVWESATSRAAQTTREYAPNRSGRDQLVQWATARAGELTPSAWGRALFETVFHEHFHITALTGLPSLHIYPEPEMLLRERIENLDPASLRRFDIRWVIAEGKSPELGDPATEQVIGGFHIREVAAWDGQFARIERGIGSVKTTRLDDGGVTIQVTGTEPVLVALGTGYYPRWRARHQSGAREPVFAYESVPSGQLHVVAAWVAPGETTFTCDGPLPSDHHGALITWLALLGTLAGVGVWRVKRLAHLRRRVLLVVARAHLRVRASAGLIARVGVPVVVLALGVRGCLDRHRPIRALEIGTGIRGTATVKARHDNSEQWQSCRYSRLAATYTCPGLLSARDGMVALINDAPPSWAFNTPGIVVTAMAGRVELHVALRARLGGRYLGGASVPAQLVVDGAGHALGNAVIDFADRGAHRVVLDATVPAGISAFSLVREAAIQPDRSGLPVAPAEAPEAVRRIVH